MDCLLQIFSMNVMVATTQKPTIRGRESQTTQHTRYSKRAREGTELPSQKTFLSTYPSVITSNGKDLNALNKRQVGWRKNKTLSYAAYKRLTSDVMTPTYTRCRDGKTFSKPMAVRKVSHGSNTRIRQNRL